MVVFCRDKAIKNNFAVPVSVIIFGMKYLYLSLQLATKLFTFKINSVYGLQKVLQSRSSQVRRSAKSHKSKKILYG